MLQVEQLKLHLPAGFEHRAGRIAQLVGDALSEIRLGHSRQLDRLSVDPINVTAGSTDADIANLISQRIVSALEQTE